MSTTLLCLTCAGSAIWIAAVFRRLRPLKTKLSARYSLDETSRHVMTAFQRLFSAEERRYVDAHSSSPGLGRELQQKRRQVFVVYLQQLKSEHAIATRQLHSLATELDRPELATKAVRQMVRFSTRYYLLRLQLALGLPVTSRTVGWAAMSSKTTGRISAAATHSAGADMQQTAVR